MSAAVSLAGGWQAGSLAVMPAVQTHAQIAFRNLRPVEREERIAEAVASSCVAYQRLAAQGKLGVARPSMLAQYAVCHVRSGRHVGGRQNGPKDVMSPVCQDRHGISITSYAERQRSRCGWRRDGWRALVVAEGRDSIAETVAFRLDFAQFLRTLSRRDRRVISWLVRGDRPTKIAQRLGVCPARVTQLRHEYERRWATFQGETATSAQAA